MAHARTVSLQRYVDQRLGSPTGAWDALRRMFVLAFTASSFAAFWRYWNPVYGYYLYYWAYRPLRRLVPRPVAVVVTFAGCGLLLHDLPHLPFTGIPLITMWFVVLSIGVLLSDALRMDLSGQPRMLRVASNVLYLVVSFDVGRRLALLISGP